MSLLSGGVVSVCSRDVSVHGPSSRGLNRTRREPVHHSDPRAFVGVVLTTCTDQMMPVLALYVARSSLFPNAHSAPSASHFPRPSLCPKWSLGRVIFLLSIRSARLARHPSTPARTSRPVKRPPSARSSPSLLTRDSPCRCHQRRSLRSSQIPSSAPSASLSARSSGCRKSASWSVISSSRA